jgi:hypothetical protein
MSVAAVPRDLASGSGVRCSWLLNLSDLDTTTGKVSFVVWLVAAGACVWQLRQIARESENLAPGRELRDYRPVARVLGADRSSWRAGHRGTTPHGLSVQPMSVRMVTFPAARVSGRSR